MTSVEFETIKGNKKQTPEFQKKKPTQSFRSSLCCGISSVITYRELRLLELWYCATYKSGQ
jgi:hypothetical protein